MIAAILFVIFKAIAEVAYWGALAGFILWICGPIPYPDDFSLALFLVAFVFAILAAICKGLMK